MINTNTSHRFDHYLQQCNQCNLHPELTTVLPSTLENLIFYGPSGTGKYTQALHYISQFSPSKLKYEKKVSVCFNNETTLFKISDIHYEVDMEMLGCNAKLFWHEIFQKITDIIMAKSQKVGILLCKNVHEISPDLLDIFYSYMQPCDIHPAIQLTFVLLTEKISFVPENILTVATLIPVTRPSRKKYAQIVPLDNVADVSMITNIKFCNSCYTLETCEMHTQMHISEKLASFVLDVVQVKHKTGEKEKGVKEKGEKGEKEKNVPYFYLRELLYEILVYKLDVYEVLWNTLRNIARSMEISNTQWNEILQSLQYFLNNYNNNYRPIFHLEGIVMSLCNQLQPSTIC